MDNKSFRQQIIDLEVGHSITVPVDMVGYTTIRGYACDLGFALNRRYSTHRSRANRTYTIIRTA